MVIDQSKNLDSPLQLECSDDPLTDAQTAHHKKKLENIFLLHSALQNAIFKDGNFEHSNGVSSPDSGSYDVSKMAVGFDASIMNGGSANNAAGQLLHLMLTRNNGPGLPPPASDSSRSNANAKEKKGYMRKPRIQVKAVADIAEVQPTLTQKLRATRKTSGVLPAPRVDLKTIDDDEIEVVGEKRKLASSGASSVSGSSLGYGQQGFKPILPRMTPHTRSPVTHSAIKLKPSTFNTILLTISIKPKNVASVTVNAAQRKDLDAKVKTILIKTTPEFVEYLLNQGLIRSQQYCSIHKNVNMQANKLKLGIFNDPQTLPNSGGYVWLGECCGKKYVSVYAGSIFGTTPTDKVQPSTIPKLIYHWSCQTAIANVETWVKVERNFIGKVFHYFRAICSIILHDKVFDFGIGEEKVELGIVSLGTTTPNGNKKSVKVEILGLYDRKTSSYRLFASAPESVTNARERFVRILKPIAGVVSKSAVIICDQSVDPTCLQQLGYSKIEICNAREEETSPASNGTIMTYLRRHVPKMFQVALSSLSEAQVQMCLDELCWREKYGYTSLNCFENMMEHISYLTLMEIDNPGLIALLDYVSENPHKNWRYKDNSTPPKPSPKIKAQILQPPPEGTLNVLNTQSVDPKKLHPITHGNKVMSESAASSLSLSIGGRSNRMTNSPIHSNSIKSVSIQQNASVSPIIQQQNVVIDKSLPLDRSKFKTIETYFYAKILGDMNLGQEKNTSPFKCHLCSDTYSDNIDFYTHLKYHIEGVTADKEKCDLMCPYCMSSFDSLNALSRHKIDIHLMSDLNQLWCRICSEKMPNENGLKLHMVRKHVESEMPYRCQVCNFSTSFYYEIINHFSKSHHGSPYVQCHLCLTVKTITSLSANTFSMRMFTHMTKHVKKMKCFQCNLSFYCKSQIADHKHQHLTCVDAPGLVSYEPPSSYRMIQFKPAIRSQMNPQSLQLLKNPKLQVAMSLTMHNSPRLRIELFDHSEDIRCFECEGIINSANHFSSERSCTKCSYVTSCANIIGKHSELLHSRSVANYKLGRSIILPSRMRCNCGFMTHSGNHMARHLVMCGYTTAYPVERKPMTAIEPDNLFIPKIEITEEEDKTVLTSDSVIEGMMQVDEGDGKPGEVMEIDDDAELPLIMPLDVQLEEN